MCAKSTKKFKISYAVDAYCITLKSAFGIDISNDEQNVHPKRFCHSCYNVLKRIEAAKQQDRYYKHKVKVHDWNKMPAKISGRPKSNTLIVPKSLLSVI